MLGEWRLALGSKYTVHIHQVLLDSGRAGIGVTARTIGHVVSEMLEPPSIANPTLVTQLTAPIFYAWSRLYQSQILVSFDLPISPRSPSCLCRGPHQPNLLCYCPMCGPYLHSSWTGRNTRHIMPYYFTWAGLTQYASADWIQFSESLLKLAHTFYQTSKVTLGSNPQLCHRSNPERGSGLCRNEFLTT